MRIAVAAHAAQGAEVVVEGAVFLHQDDDVLDVLDGPGAVVAGQFQRAGDAGRKQGGERSAAEQTQEVATIRRGHMIIPLKCGVTESHRG